MYAFTGSIGLLAASQPSTLVWTVLQMRHAPTMQTWMTSQTFTLCMPADACRATRRGSVPMQIDGTLQAETRLVACKHWSAISFIMDDQTKEVEREPPCPDGCQVVRSYIVTTAVSDPGTYCKPCLRLFSPGKSCPVGLWKSARLCLRSRGSLKLPCWRWSEVRRPLLIGACTYSGNVKDRGVIFQTFITALNAAAGNLHHKKRTYYKKSTCRSSAWEGFASIGILFLTVLPAVRARLRSWWRHLVDSGHRDKSRILWSHIGFIGFALQFGRGMVTPHLLFIL